MKILALDTSTKFLSLGITDGKKIYECCLETGVKLSSLLMPTIKRTLLSLRMRPGDIDYFACGLGPGSFTGIRVGMSAVKGLAWALKKPVVGIPTLDALARNMYPVKKSIFEPGDTCQGVRPQDVIIAPVIDAKRKLLYSSVYKMRGSKLTRVSAYFLVTPQELSGKIESFCGSKKENTTLLLAGDGADLYRQAIAHCRLRIVVLDKDRWYPQPRHMIALAQEKIASGKESTVYALKPLYLYPKECQIRCTKATDK
ncbi:MAG: tRNA (adenosine(37)-N6)-threonylcarbamoyltransferase complex dimerization subunit type 1 TsaB [Candidatus Omnitrophota bacterium]|jgi:tRNA threonylcarbamoyladenosine biosynthesis protein TsaB